MKRKQIKILSKKILVTVLTVCTITTGLMYGNIPTVYAAHEKENEEISYEEIQISSVQDLMDLAEKCHSDTWSSDKLVTLTQDIDLSGSDFNFIAYFDGYFDGKGYTISNYQFDADGYEVGFFRYIGENGTVCNLTVTGSVNVEEEQQCIGGLCGVNKGTIRNCVFQGMVSGKTQTGSIAGLNDTTGVIQKCTVKGKVSGYYYTGGVAGKNLGLIDNCINYANINDSGKWVEGDDENTLEILRDISSNSQKLKVQSGVDTGGIAGYSEGQILRCSNQGIVGYERTGYNIGGIVGRQSGLVAYCTNAGTVYGRKDVGGIAGQIEPYIEIDEAESIRSATNKLHDLVSQTITDMENGTDAIHADLDNLQSLSDGVLDTGDSIADGLTDYINNNTVSANDLFDRANYVMNELPQVLDKIKTANTTMGKMTDVLNSLRNDLNLQNKLSGDSYNETKYRRLTLNAGIGGTLSTDSTNPDEGTAVTITVAEDNGYLLKNITVTDAAAKEISLTKTGYGTYTFVMPKENVMVSAEFFYEGAYLAESDAGGKLSITNNQSAGTITVEADANEGYSLASSVTIGTNTISLSGGKATVNKADYPTDGKPVIVKADFGSRDITGGSTTNAGDTHKITRAAGTGGSVTTTVLTAESGDTVYVVPAASNGYQFSQLHIRKMSDGSEITTKKVSDQYSFEMPDEDVYVEAQFVPAELILLSNPGGSASFYEKDDIVTLTVSPNSGYTVSTTPVVKNVNGNDISVTKNTEGTFVYKFSMPAVETPATATITFKKQNENDAVSAAMNRVTENINTLTSLSSQISDALDKLKNDLTNADGSFNKNNLTNDQTWNDLMDLLELLTEAGEATSQIVSDLNVISNIYGPYLKDAANGANTDLANAIDIFSSANSSLKSATDKVRSVIDNLNARGSIEIAKINSDLQANVDLIHDQLKAVSVCMGNLTEHADNSSKKVLEDFRAVNDQISVVVNLFADNLSSAEVTEWYEDISEEEVDSATTGTVSNSTNKGYINGDYNVGGICGSMAIDEEDPEDSAAGTIDKQLGNKYTALCVIRNSDNQGYVTARKDGAGGIAGYMKQGIVTKSKSGGSVKSTEGDFVGGICGESLAIIRDCYALSMISGDKNVGGIAGYGSTITGCYSIANIMEATGRYGAIAGQVAEQEQNEDGDKGVKHIADNYFVNNTVYGIDNISYAGAAEQISYEQLIETEGIPDDFQHLKVTFLMDGTELGTMELAYGESLDDLTYPQVPKQNGSYGIWPDVSDLQMTGNLVVEGEYVDNIATLQSDAYVLITEGDKQSKKTFMLAEGTFTHKAKLKVQKVDNYPDDKLTGKGNKATYQVLLESNNLSPKDVTNLRIYNTKDKVDIWSYTNGSWQKLTTEQKGHYLQFSMEGKEGVFCVVEKVRDIKKILVIAAYVAGCVLLICLVGCIIKKSRKKSGLKKRGKKSQTEEKNEV